MVRIMRLPLSLAVALALLTGGVPAAFASSPDPAESPAPRLPETAEQIEARIDAERTEEEALRRIKQRFDELGIEIPVPHRVVFHRREGERESEELPAVPRLDVVRTAGAGRDADAVSPTHDEDD